MQQLAHQYHQESFNHSFADLIKAGDDFEQYFASTSSFPGWGKVNASDYASYLSDLHRQHSSKIDNQVTCLDELGELLVDTQHLEGNPFNLANVFAIYLDGVRQSSAATITGYENDLKLFRHFLQKKGQWHGWLSIGSVDIQVYLTHLNDLGRQWTTINRELSSLRTFYNFLMTNHLVDQNPFEDIKIKRHARNLPRYFYEPEMNALFKAADGEGRPLDFRNRAIIELLYATGMRVSECAKLELSQIQWDLQLILVHGKGNKDRYVPFGNYAKKALQRYLKECRTPLLDRYHQHHDVVFVNQYGKPITSEGIEYILNQVVKHSSLNMKIHPHMLRHTFATAMLNNGADIRSVQELLGHASLSTTQIYTHVTRENLQKTYMKLFPRAKAKGDNQS